MFVIQLQTLTTKYYYAKIVKLCILIFKAGQNASLRQMFRYIFSVLQMQ